MALKETRSAKIAFCGVLIGAGLFVLYQAYLLPWPRSQGPASGGASLVALGSFLLFLFWYIHDL